MMAKAKKPRAPKYDSPLKVTGTFDEVLKISTDYTAHMKQPKKKAAKNK